MALTTEGIAGVLGEPLPRNRVGGGQRANTDFLIINNSITANFREASAMSLSKREKHGVLSEEGGVRKWEG